MGEASVAKVAGKDQSNAEDQDTKLESSDKMLKCIDCEIDFVFSADEQRMFKDFGWEVKPPKRCHVCRREKKERNQRIAEKQKGLVGKGKGKLGKSGKSKGHGQSSRDREDDGK